jgi:DNA repair exonuclease SbcCD ATPase subunit
MNEVDEIKRTVKELQEEKVETSNVLKDFREKNKEMMTTIKDAAAEIRVAREALLARKDHVNKVKGEATVDDSKAKKDELKQARADVKKAAQHLKDLRAKSIKLRNTKLAKRLEVGRGSIGDVSVETALKKKCLKRGLY